MAPSRAGEALPGAGGPRARPAAVLAVCCSSLFLVGLDVTVVNVGLPAIAASLHAQVSGLQWTVAGYTIALASMLLFSGALADRIGRRAVFQVGLSMFTLGSWLCSLAPGIGWLVAFRVLQGVGGSMLNPAAMGIVANTFTAPAARARALGAWDATMGLSMALGPLLGGLLVGVAGWRAVFWVNIPAGLAAVCLAAVVVPESRAARARRADPGGQCLVIVMLAAMSYAIIQAPGHGWASPGIYGPAVLAAAALAALVGWEPRRAEPLVDVRAFRRVPFAGSAACAAAAVCAQSAFLFLSTLYLQDVRGFSALRAGVVILPMPAAMALCSPVAGRLVTRWGSRWPLLAGGAALTLSSAALARLTATSPALFLAVTYAGFGAGMGLANPGITNGIMSGLPAGQAGVASGINSSFRQVGQSLGVAVTGSLLASALHGGMRAGFLPAARPAWLVMAACGGLVMLLGYATTAGQPALPAVARSGAGAAPEARAGRGRHRGRHRASRQPPRPGEGSVPARPAGPGQRGALGRAVIPADSVRPGSLTG